jgi:hypothetical protein
LADFGQARSHAQGYLVTVWPDFGRTSQAVATSADLESAYDRASKAIGAVKTVTQHLDVLSDAQLNHGFSEVRLNSL